MLPTLRSLSILTLAATSVMIGACASEKPATAHVNWSYPGEPQPTASTKPLMRLATLPMNPAPAAPLEDYTEEPTRFIFRPRIIILDEDTGTVQDAGAAEGADMGAGAGGMGGVGEGG
jgi:hypothetical protein